MGELARGEKRAKGVGNMRAALHALAAAVMVMAVCGASVDVDQPLTLPSGRHGFGEGRLAVNLLQEDQSPDDQLAKNDDAQKNQAEDAEDEEKAAEDNEEGKQTEDTQQEDTEASAPEPTGEKEKEIDADVETASKEEADQQTQDDEAQEETTTEDTHSDDSKQPAPETEENSAEDAAATKSTDDADDYPDPAIYDRKRLSLEDVRTKVEEYARKAEEAIKSAPEEKRVKLVGKVQKAMAKQAIYTAQTMRDDAARHKHKYEFKKENLAGKMAKVAIETNDFKRKEKQLAANMNKTWAEEQQDLAQLKENAKNTQIEVVEHKHKKYLEWKEQLEVATSKQIGEFQKAAASFRSKTAEETARFNKLSADLKKKKASLKERGSKELRHKEEAAKVKEQRVKTKEKLTKEDEKLSSEKQNEKVIKTTSEAKEKKEGPASSTETAKAEAALQKVDSNLHFLNKEVSTEVTEASEDALRAQNLMLKEREKAANRTTNTSSNETDIEVDTNVTTTSKKKCGPGVLCDLYNQVVSKVGGSDKYFKVEMEELSKLKGDGEPTPDMERKAFDNIAERFGVTGPGTEGKICGPGVPCELYNRVMKEAGGSAKLLKEESAEQEKLLKAEAERLKKEGSDKKAEVTEAMKKEAFDKVADRHGISVSIRRTTSELADLGI